MKKIKTTFKLACVLVLVCVLWIILVKTFIPQETPNYSITRNDADADFLASMAKRYSSESLTYFGKEDGGGRFGLTDGEWSHECKKECVNQDLKTVAAMYRKYGIFEVSPHEDHIYFWMAYSVRWVAPFEYYPQGIDELTRQRLIKENKAIINQHWAQGVPLPSS